MDLGIMYLSLFHNIDAGLSLARASKSLPGIEINSIPVTHSSASIL